MAVMEMSQKQTNGCLKLDSNNIGRYLNKKVFIAMLIHIKVQENYLSKQSYDSR